MSALLNERLAQIDTAESRVLLRIGWDARRPFIQLTVSEDRPLKAVQVASCRLMPLQALELIEDLSEALKHLDSTRRDSEGAA